MTSPRSARIASSSQHHSQNNPKPTSTHFTAIDGLRALAILGVVSYHARPSLLRGGFLGVTIFFVISGFLITRSVATEINHTGTFSYGTYAAKRLKRLVPPVVVVIALTTLGAYLTAPGLLPKAQSDALPSLLFVGNWVNIFRHVSYFAAAGLPSPLTHLWFLGVLMQFYLLWPLVMFALYRAKLPRGIRINIVAILTLASTIAMALLFNPNATGSRSYYGLDTRAAELLTGALLAMLITDHRQSPKGSNSDSHRIQPHHLDFGDALALMPLTLLIVAFIVAQSSWTVLYFGGYLVVALLTTLLLAAAIVPGNRVGRALSVCPLRYIGSRSFSLYLVHYPMLEMMNPATRTTKLAWWEWIVQALMLWAATEMFYQLIERTIRLGASSTRIKARAKHDVRAIALRFVQVCRRIIIVLCTLGTVLLCVLPLDWGAIAQARSAQLRPATAKVEATPAQNHSAPKPADKPAQQANQQTSNAGTLVPVAEKVPNNLDTSGWTYDASTGVCSADPLIISDSVEMGAQRVLVNTMPNAVQDNEIGRSLTAFPSTYQQHLAAGDNKRVVIAALGTNSAGANPEQSFEDAVGAVKGKPLYFITVRNPAMNQDAVNAAMRAVAARHKNVGIMDWYGLSEGHSEYFYDDGVHLTIGAGLGREAYSHMIIQALCGQ
ncbi:acyltransferase family protein [Bifidobacterium cebidarum]|uniref:Acyltransferase n=1 Tax=Bifidobacterium cebidarum TaxID=2650773 RepID=A0A6I1GB21_9BIFI|nr:acyltransferase family protein [Bifidobacterium cebidarum]KAB7788755.1 acyltransferase [Bifidobacterium cebidarum]